MMQIDQQTHKIKVVNRYKERPKKTQIIIGFSLRKNDFHVKRLKHKDYGGTKKWNTFTVSRDGIVFQHYNPKFYTDYMGVKKIDKQSISIVLENMGGLGKGSDDKYMNWLGEECDKNLVDSKKFLSQNYWEIIPDIQLENTAVLCKNLCEEFNIPTKIVDFHHYNKGAVNYNGIILVSNYWQETNNVNPFFDLVKFNELLNN